MCCYLRIMVVMTKDNDIQDADVMVRLLADEANRDLLYNALQESLKADPAAFYKNFVLPRSSKMREAVADNIVSRLTITQEVARMNRTTAPPPPEETDATNKDT